MAMAEDAAITAILANNPDPFADVDMTKIIAAYGTEGSGVGLESISIGLQLGGILLNRETSGLVYDAASIDGATGIFSDPSGLGFTIGLSGDYLFAFDEAVLTDDASAALAEVLELYNEYDGTDISVEGHTDSKGSEDYNQTLSEQRADVVYEWFLESGIDPNLLTKAGFGETTPVAPNEIDGQDNPDGRALNRRVDIRVTTLKKVNFVPLNRE